MFTQIRAYIDENASMEKRELANHISKTFYQDEIGFGEAAAIDKFLFGESGGYWLESYDYPSKGDRIMIPLSNGSNASVTVISAGLFTLDVDYS